MKKFLEKVADEILKNYGADNSRHVVIVPNKRSEIFLKNHLKEKTATTLWLPEFFTIDEFITASSGLVSLDPILIYFELYEIHKTIQEKETMPLEDFLSWAPIMLSDFNDIDLHLGDAEYIFKHLTEAKAIEQWNLEGKPLTALQKNYLFFYRSLYSYYTELKKRLAIKRAGYKGMIYRHLCENISSHTGKWEGFTFSFVGFNALTNSELTIFGYLKNNFATTIYLDTDLYYLGTASTNAQQSGAGRFINEMITDWGLKNITWIDDALTSAKNKVSVYGVAKQVGQVKFAGKKLEKWLDNLDPGADSKDIAVVLADENLLVPLLHSLPKERKGNKMITYNVTMGYPLMQSAMGRFIQQWLNFLIRFSGNKFGTTDLIQLINNPITALLLDDANAKMRTTLIHDLLETGKVYLNTEEFFSLLPENKKDSVTLLFSNLLSGTPDVIRFLDSLTDLSGLSKELIERKGHTAFPLLKEQLSKTHSLVAKSRLMLENQKGAINLKAFQKILLQLMRRSEINLKGEPLEGIQIMGMLETRNLDFKKIIVLSANEGILPKTGTMESFIPFDIRHDNKLPLPKEQNDIYAYYFLRLLQRAEQVALVYNTDSDKFGGGEKSRFILQLEHELPQIFTDKEKLVHLSTPVSETQNTISIAKNDTILKGLKNKARSGFSASSLNVYRNCPLKFYFSEVLQLKEKQKIEPEIEFNVFGNAIHGVLENIYRNFLGKNIDPAELKKFIPKAGMLLDKELAEIYKGGNTKTGKNHLIYEVAKKYIVQFLKYEAGKSGMSGIQIVGLEERIKETARLGDYEVTLKGFLDRVERTETGDIRIIDYKTGKVEPNDLKLNTKTTETEQLAEGKKEKLFQLLFYAYLYRLHSGDSAYPRLGIYSLRMLSSYGLIETDLPGGIDFFEDYLTGLIAEIFDPSVSFSQTEDDRICDYCDFKDICNR